jgi:hypothetical protein
MNMSSENVIGSVLARVDEDLENARERLFDWLL